MASAGYSGTPLPQKLGIKPGMTLHVWTRPWIGALIAPMGHRVAFATRLTKDVELVHAFVTKKGRLSDVLDSARAGLGSEAIVWVSWPKKAAKLASEVTEDTVRDIALPLGFVDVKVCASTTPGPPSKLVVRKTLPNYNASAAARSWDLRKKTSEPTSEGTREQHREPGTHVIPAMI